MIGCFWPHESHPIPPAAGPSYLDAGSGGVWGLEHRDGVKMDGQAAEHIREAAPVLARYADAIGVRAFPKLEKWADEGGRKVS